MKKNHSFTNENEDFYLVMLKILKISVVFLASPSALSFREKCC